MNRSAIFADTGDNTAFSISPTDAHFNVTLNGLADVLARCGMKPATCHFDAEGSILGLIHEMRHMGTPNYGNGDMASLSLPVQFDPNGKVEAQNSRIAGAQHMLNELEDYVIMFQHPWAMGMPADSLARMREEFAAGANQERACFAWQWTDKYPRDDGAPPNSSGGPMVAPAMPMGMAGMGLIGLGGLAAHPVQLPALKALPAFLKQTADRGHCVGNDPLSSDNIERCAVALWVGGAQ